MVDNKPTGPEAAASTASPSVFRPEVVRRSIDYSSATVGDQPMGGHNDGKKLVVGRDIELSGAINACEKLVVEGRVETSITDCREIEISNTGLFKGDADIEIAEISGTFEGTLTARQLLIVRSSGRVSGNIRYGDVEIERGGRIDGDVGSIATAEENAAGDPTMATPTRTA